MSKYIFLYMKSPKTIFEKGFIEARDKHNAFSLAIIKYGLDLRNNEDSLPFDSITIIKNNDDENKFNHEYNKVLGNRFK